jgi:hypothetical protein
MEGGEVEPALHSSFGEFFYEERIIGGERIKRREN